MKFGYFSQLQMPKPWRENGEILLYKEAMEQAVYAESVGFQYYWQTEHHFYSEIGHSSSPELFLAALAQRTSTIRLGLGVVVLPCNHPYRVVEYVSTLDHLSDGRVEFGTGRGASPYHIEAFGITSEQSKELWNESLNVISSMFLNDPFPGWQGKWYQDLPQRHLVPKPVQKPHPPLWMACTQEDTFQLAGDLGLGCLVNTLGGTHKTRSLIETYYRAVENATPAGHFINKQVVASTIGFCGENDAEARQKGAEVAGWYLEQSRKRFTLEWSGVDPNLVPEDYQFYFQGGARSGPPEDPQQQAPDHDRGDQEVRSPAKRACQTDRKKVARSGPDFGEHRGGRPRQNRGAPLRHGLGVAHLRRSRKIDTFSLRTTRKNGEHPRWVGPRHFLPTRLNAIPDSCFHQPVPHHSEAYARLKHVEAPCSESQCRPAKRKAFRPRWPSVPFQ